MNDKQKKQKTRIYAGVETTADVKTWPFPQKTKAKASPEPVKVRAQKRNIKALADLMLGDE